METSSQGKQISVQLVQKLMLLRVIWRSILSPPPELPLSLHIVIHFSLYYGGNFLQKEPTTLNLVSVLLYLAVLLLVFFSMFHISKFLYQYFASGWLSESDNRVKINQQEQRGTEQVLIQCWSLPFTFHLSALNILESSTIFLLWFSQREACRSFPYMCNATNEPVHFCQSHVTMCKQVAIKHLLRKHKGYIETPLWIQF